MLRRMPGVCRVAIALRKIPSPLLPSQLSACPSCYFATRPWTSPPNASGLPALIHYEERRLLAFPLHHVYSIVSNVNDYKLFVPWCVNSLIVRSPPHPAQPLEAELAVGFRMFSERYTSRVTLVPHKSVMAVASGTTLFSHLVNVWEFEPGASPGTTWLTFRVEFQFRSHLYASASQLFFNEVVKNMVKAFEARCSETFDGYMALKRREAEAAADALARLAAAKAALTIAASAAQQQQHPRGARAVPPLRPGLW